eukprot:2819057-Ditylum_brightwellii.AAC.1
MAPKVQNFRSEYLKKFESCLPPHDWPSCSSTSNLSTPKYKVTALRAYGSFLALTQCHIQEYNCTLELSALYGNTTSYHKLYNLV